MLDQEMRDFWYANLFDGVQGGKVTFHSIDKLVDDLTQLGFVLYEKGKEDITANTL